MSSVIDAPKASLRSEKEHPIAPKPIWKLTERLARCTRPTLVSISFVLLALIGAVDYLTGFEISVLIFYLLPVSLAAWCVGHRFAVLISVLSVSIWLAGDIGAGAIYRSKAVLAWNAAIALGFFLVVTWLLDSLRRLVRDLEARVKQRTAALTDEMAERARLEIEILEISEREQRRIGHDLHDGLGQHLTGTALSAQVLSDRFETRGLAEEAGEMSRLVTLVEEAISLTRALAHGLSPVAVEVEGLDVALAELAATTSAQFYLPCEFSFDSAARVTNPTAATHLYRITQEAITNAIRHGQAGRVDISLTRRKDGSETILEIRDNGIGLKQSIHGNSEGQGLRIMAHRARILGARLEISAGDLSGTIVRCFLNQPKTEDRTL